MWVTKTKVFWISLVPAVGYAFLVYFHDTLYDFCIEQGRCWRFWDSLDIIAPIIFPWPLVFIFSLLTYKMHEKVFRAWLHFAYWWVPLSIILTLITPDGGGGWGIPNLISREIVAITSSSLFAIISLIIIIWKYLATRRST